MTELTGSGRRIVVVRCGASRNVAGRPSKTVLAAVAVVCAASDAQKMISRDRKQIFRMASLILSTRIDIGESPRRESQSHPVEAAAADPLPSSPGAAAATRGAPAQSARSRRSPRPEQHPAFRQSMVASPGSSHEARAPSPRSAREQCLCRAQSEVPGFLVLDRWRDG